MTKSYFELLSIEKPVVKIDQLIKSSIYKSNSISIVYLRYIRVFFIRYEKWFLVCIYVFSLETKDIVRNNENTEEERNNDCSVAVEFPGNNENVFIKPSTQVRYIDG